MNIYVKYGLKIYERFGDLSLEKYGILKWKMCRNPAISFQAKNIGENESLSHTF